jgi:drug/metabolite transporter (DMT)-like permease
MTEETAIGGKPAPAGLPAGERLRANLGMLFTVCCWGAFFPVLERLLQSWDIYSATLGRQILSGVTLFILVIADRRRSPLPRMISWRRMLALGGIGVALGSMLTTIGVQYSSGLSSAIISTTNPVSAAITASLLYREPLGRAIIIGTLLSVAGGLVSVLGGQADGAAHFRGGEILIILANVTWTWMSMAAQRWLGGYSQLQITAYTVAAGSFWLLILLPFVYASGVVELHVGLGLESIALMLFASILPNALGNFGWHYAVSRLGVVTASMYTNLLPAAAVAATLLLGGSFRWTQLAGSAVILVGVFLAQSPALRPRR